MTQYATRSIGILAAALLTAGAAAGLTPASAATQLRPIAEANVALHTGPAAATTSGTLSGVAAVSARQAWAVGAGPRGHSLILRWNGTTWAQVASPSGRLSGVAATSARNAWAVGCSACSAVTPRPLILHWDGSSWTQVPAATAGRGNQFSGVAAESARDAWAVGSTGHGATLIEHWNGTAWKRVPSPSPAAGQLLGVTAVSTRLAWAVGFTRSGHSLILRWNGNVWKRVPSPSPGPAHGLADALESVAATSAGQAWAVGNTGCGCGPGASLIERWNGTSWKQVSSPTTKTGGISLNSVAATSASSAWAAGISGSGDGPTRTVIARWNGTSWQQVPSPSPRGSAELAGIATAGGSAWAVGSTSTKGHTAFRTLILRWNGTAWK